MGDRALAKLVLISLATKHPFRHSEQKMDAKRHFHNHNNSKPHPKSGRDESKSLSIPHAVISILTICPIYFRLRVTIVSLPDTPHSDAFTWPNHHGTPLFGQWKTTDTSSEEPAPRDTTTTGNPETWCREVRTEGRALVCIYSYPETASGATSCRSPNVARVNPILLHCLSQF